jgi:hypothetical protein
VRKEIARVMIDTLKGGALLFAYYPDQKWLREAPTLSCGAAQGPRIAAAPAGTRPRG